MIVSLTRRFYQAFYPPNPLLPVYQIQCSDDANFRPTKIARLHPENLRASKAPQKQRPNYIQHLPWELLTLVFQFYLNQKGQDISVGCAIRAPSITSTLGSSASPFILICVCSNWRKVARSSPSLWSSLAVYRPRISQMEVIELWLSQSRNLPLSLSIHQPLVDKDHPAEATAHILLMFNRFAHRWRELSIKLKGDFPSNLLSSIPMQSLSTLEHVELDFYENDYNSPMWQAFYSLPSLRKVSWVTTYPHGELTTKVPWAQLTHLQLPQSASINIDGLLRALIYCHNLVDLEISMTMPTKNAPLPSTRFDNASQSALRSLRMVPDAGPQKRVSDGVALGRAMKRDHDIAMALLSPIDLPRLRVLKVHAHGRDAAPLLDRLKLPALTRLDILHYVSSDAQPQTSYIVRLLDRSLATRFHTLSIYDPDMTADEVVELLSSPRLNHLRDLELSVNYVDDSVIELLTHTHVYRAPRRLPHLKRLVLPDCLTSGGSLTTMVESRMPTLGTLIFSVSAGTPLHRDVAGLRNIAAQSSFCLSVL